MRRGSGRGATEWLFFATVFTVTFAKVHWAIGGDLSLSDVLTALFLVTFVTRRLERWDGRFARPAGATFAFFVAFLLVYLLGFFNLGTTDALDQWGKGMVKFLLHFLFLVTGTALVVRRGDRFYWQTLGAFIAGIAASAVYGLLQLGVAVATGGNLDAAVLSPLTGGQSLDRGGDRCSGSSIVLLSRFRPCCKRIWASITILIGSRRQGFSRVTNGFSLMQPTCSFTV